MYTVCRVSSRRTSSRIRIQPALSFKACGCRARLGQPAERRQTQSNARAPYDIQYQSRHSHPTLPNHIPWSYHWIRQLHKWCSMVPLCQQRLSWLMLATDNPNTHFLVATVGLAHKRTVLPWSRFRPGSRAQSQHKGVLSLNAEKQDRSRQNLPETRPISSSLSPSRLNRCQPSSCLSHHVTETLVSVITSLKYTVISLR